MKLLLVVVAPVAVLFACDFKPAPPSAAPESSSTAGAPVDWSSVTAARDGSQIVAAKTIARHADAWYRGSRPTIELTFRNGQAVDADGNSVAVTPEQWKGIIADTRSATEARPASAAASKSSFYSTGTPGLPQDTFGTLPRYMYRLEAVDDNTLRLRTPYKVDDGV